MKSVENRIVINDIDQCVAIIDRLAGNPIRRVDIILDNAGLELFGDLCFAELLISTNLADKVVFHGKAIPWFVSDVTIEDFVWTLEMLGNSSDESLAFFGRRWCQRMESDAFSFERHLFWTSPYSFWEMPIRAPDLFAHLNKSSLLIFKGDLNYRKLIHDRAWSWNEQFKRALGDFCPKSPLVALRTCKADVIVGMDESMIGKMKGQFGSSTEWMVNGEYALIQLAINE